MLKNESMWFKSILSEFNINEICPILNIGSGDENKRKIDLPYLNKNIFEPLKERNASIYHLDIKDGKGVDIVGDISNKATLQSIKDLNIKSIFCMNLLEHVYNRENVCENILSIIPKGGYLFVSCPYKFPKHEDPIDTLFRPNINELTALFPNTEIVKSKIVVCGKALCLHEGKEKSFLHLVLKMIFRFKLKDWIWNVRLLPYINKEFMVTCIVLKKN